MPETTQNTGTAAGSDATSATGASAQQGPTSSQPTDAAAVDSGSVEANRNSGHGDGGDGGNSNDGGRQREGRAERTIKDLRARIKELETQNTEGNLSQQLLKTRLDPTKVQLPDYSNQDSITPQQIQADILKAAEQIVDVKMGVLADSLEKRVARKDAAGDALRQIEAAKKKYKVLDESNDEFYNKDLDENIGNGYYEIFKVNPNYSFSDYLKSFVPVLEVAETNARNGATDSVSNRGTQATRGGTGSRRTQKRVEDMSLDELEAHIHNSQ